MDRRHLVVDCLEKTMSEKKGGKREESRQRKSALRAEIDAIRQRIRAALAAPRVPARVMNGDAIVVARWKEAIANGTTTDHYIDHPPPQRMTESRLCRVRERLCRVLVELT
jgi:hypothetical protein